MQVLKATVALPDRLEVIQALPLPTQASWRFLEGWQCRWAGPFQLGIEKGCGFCGVPQRDPSPGVHSEPPSSAIWAWAELQGPKQREGQGEHCRGMLGNPLTSFSSLHFAVTEPGKQLSSLQLGREEN